MNKINRKFGPWAAAAVLSGFALGHFGDPAAQPSSSASEGPVLVLMHGRVYPAPDMPPLDNATVVMRGGRIAAIEAGSATAPPAGSRIIDCTGLVITAGFQNSHVHFTERKWAGPAAQPAAKLESQLADMLTRYGFTTVVDTGSDPRDTMVLRARLQSGDVAGPRVLTSGSALYPPDGIPFYLKETLPAAVLPYLDTPPTPQEAARVVQRDIAGGADIIKIFTGS